MNFIATLEKFEKSGGSKVDDAATRFLIYSTTGILTDICTVTGENGDEFQIMPTDPFEAGVRDVERFWFKYAAEERQYYPSPIIAAAAFTAGYLDWKWSGKKARVDRVDLL